MSNIKNQRKAKLIQNEISEALSFLDIPNTCITRVEVSNDCRSAKVYCLSTAISHSTEEKKQNDKEAAILLQSRIHAISKKIASRAPGRGLPKITFLPDSGIRVAERISEILDSID